MTKNYTQKWAKLLRANRGIEASAVERGHLNAAIAAITIDGCYETYLSSISLQMQKAAKKMMRRARKENCEPLECLVAVCNGFAGLDVTVESFLIATKYAEVC